MEEQQQQWVRRYLRATPQDRPTLGPASQASHRASTLPHLVVVVE